MTEIKPCPFCGAKAEWAEVYNPDPILRLVSVGCEACDIYFQGCRETLKEAREVAIEKWNRRAE